MTDAIADSSSPRLAAYYDRKMMLCGDTAYQWEGTDTPRQVATEIVQVGVGQDLSYVLSRSGNLFGWQDKPADKQKLLEQIKWFAAGDSGIFAIDETDTLWFLLHEDKWFTSRRIGQPEKIANRVRTASIGDSANYYVTHLGDLHVKGLAHRGQYGDGKLATTDRFIPVASEVVAIKSHTGHAILLSGAGVVMGTGGNIFGPLGRHGIGDKATLWGKIFSDAVAIATGSSHSAAIDASRTLWSWGRGINLDPVKVLENVEAVAADRHGTIALKDDGSLWQWDRGQKPRPHFRCP